MTLLPSSGTLDTHAAAARIGGFSAELDEAAPAEAAGLTAGP